MLTVVPDPAARDSAGRPSLIDEIVREGAQRTLAEALRAEHLRTTSPIEPALTTVRHRIRAVFRGGAQIERPAQVAA